MENAHLTTPLGTVCIWADEQGICEITFENKAKSSKKTTLESLSPLLKTAIQQLEAYFSGNLREFDLPLHPQGTDFQQRVWNSLLEIPYGETRSYLEQAKTLGNVKAIRAVASANGKNPLSIIIPCHRVIGSDGSLTGYASGIWRKKWLLEHEGALNQLSLF